MSKQAVAGRPATLLTADGGPSTQAGHVDFVGICQTGALHHIQRPQYVTGCLAIL